MTEEWFEDERSWLPPPHLPTKREVPQTVPQAGRTPPVRQRRPLHASADVVSAYPQPRTPYLTSGLAVPPSVRLPQRRYGEVMALKWLGVLLVLVAALTALALVISDVRSGSEASPSPTVQVVIPAASNAESADPPPAIVADPSFAGSVICLDAAHGGTDRGFQRSGDASAPAMDEALYTAAYARELAGRLSAMGFTVVTTRDGDAVRNAEFQDVNRDGLTREDGATDAEAAHHAQLDELQARIDFCNDEDADLLISLHFDGSLDPNESGFSTWFADGRAESPDSQRLAQLINQQLGASLVSAGIPLIDRGVRPESEAALQGSQTVYDSLFLIAGNRVGMKEASAMPGVVADLLTISNPVDAQVLASEQGREAIVRALAEAIGRYFSEMPDAQG